MTTIKEIAKQANVSEGTVDRVLHNRGGVSIKTEETIKKILKENNFTANPIARALAMKSKYKLCTLIPGYDAANLFWKSPYMGILKGSEEVKNYGIEVTNFNYNQFDPKSYVDGFNNLMELNPSAVLIVPNFVNETKQIVKQLEKNNIPYIFFNIDLDGFNNISFIGQDSHTGGYVAAKLMHLSLGDNPTILTVQTRINISNSGISKRIDGFNDYFIKNNIPIERLFLDFDNINNVDESEVALNSMLDKNSHIQGIFVPSSRISIIANCIKKKHLKSLQLVGFDNTPQNIKCLEEDKISFIISQKPFNQGFESIHLLTDYLVKKKIPIQKNYSPIDILTKENARYNERFELEYENENPDLN